MRAMHRDGPMTGRAARGEAMATVTDMGRPPAIARIADRA